MKWVRLVLLMAVLAFVVAIVGCQGFAKPGTVDMEAINYSFYGPYEMDYE